VRPGRHPDTPRRDDDSAGAADGEKIKNLTGGGGERQKFQRLTLHQSGATSGSKGEPSLAGLGEGHGRREVPGDAALKNPPA
jgi:hypothetical protein